MPPFFPDPIPVGSRPTSLAARTNPPEPAAPEKVTAENVRVLPQTERDNLDAMRHWLKSDEGWSRWMAACRGEDVPLDKKGGTA